MIHPVYFETIKKSALCVAAVCILSLLLPAAPGFAVEQKITTQLGMTFIKVEPGTFIMGSPITERRRDKSETQHEVTITSAFYLQETEVTVRQWRAIMGRPWIGKRKCREDMPVTRVSWYDCMKFIKKLSLKTGRRYRLPTEAEWEYACRAGSRTAYTWGNGIDCSKAMYGNNTKKDDECSLYYKTLNIAPNAPAPVKTFAPNAWGFYDMHGNVWEWCADSYRKYMSGPVSDSYSVVDSDSRIRRGAAGINMPTI